MTTTWASVRDAAGEAFCDKSYCVTNEHWRVCYFGFTKGADFGRASLLSELQAAEERERGLREALEKIADTAHHEDCAVFDHTETPCDCHLAIARAALALRDKGGEK